jgi:hypothetical protein
MFSLTPDGGVREDVPRFEDYAIPPLQTPAHHPCSRALCLPVSEEIGQGVKMCINTSAKACIPYLTMHTIPYHTIPYHTIPYRTIPCIPYHLQRHAYLFMGCVSTIGYRVGLESWPCLSDIPR